MCPLDVFYCLFLSLVLSFLHQLTTLLGQHLLDMNGFTGTQHVAVHFSVAFWVLTEFEFYRTYIDFRDFETTRDAIKSAWKANIDTNLPVTRDPYGIEYIKTVTRDRIRYREVALWTAQYYLFMFSCGLLNLGIKCVVDPKWTATWEEVGKAMVSGNAWYTSERAWVQLGLNLPVLMRVVRQANHVVGLAAWDLWVGRKGALGNEYGDAEVWVTKARERLENMEP
jgi:hypothetical protein